MKKNKIIFWITTSILFLFEGLMPLITLLFFHEYTTAGTEPLGYPYYFTIALIIFKVLGALVLVITKLPRQIKEWAYAGFAFNFIFATISHLAVDGFIIVSFFPLIFLALLIVSYIYNFKIS